MEKTHVYTFHPFLIICEMLPLYNVTALWVFHRTDVLYRGVNTTHRAAAISQTDCSSDHKRTPKGPLGFQSCDVALLKEDL